MEIERKWLAKILPDLTNVPKEEQERYFLFVGDIIEIRIQRINDRYEFGRKVQTGFLSREENVFEITKAEFDSLKTNSDKSLQRDNYLLQQNPEITIKVYHGEHEGLVRVEVEFESEDEANNFVPLEWFGDEITDLPLGKDKSLIRLTQIEFQKLLKKLD